MRVLKAVMAVGLAAVSAVAMAQHVRDGQQTNTITLLPHTPIPGAPYTAQAQAEWVETMSDGNTETRKYVINVARDSQGREVHWEYNMPSPADRDQKPRLNHISIYDPVTKTRERCYTKDMLCEVHTLSLHEDEVNEPGYFTPDNGLHTLVHDKLGDNYIENVHVVGTRDTYTMAAGVKGNAKPVVATKTFWYSPELHINVQTVRDDPKFGKQTITYTQISRAEPEKKLYEIPAGFRVVTSSAAQARLASEKR